MEGYVADTHGRAGRACFQPEAGEDREFNKRGFNWTHWQVDQNRSPSQQEESLAKESETHANNKSGRWTHLGHGRWGREFGNDARQEEAAKKEQQEEHHGQTAHHQTEHTGNEIWYTWWLRKSKRKKKPNPKRKRGGTKKHRRLIGPV